MSALVVQLLDGVEFLAQRGHSFDQLHVAVRFIVRALLQFLFRR